MNHTLNQELFEIMELLRNGSTISGDDRYTNLYRTRCLEQVFYRMCSNRVSGKLFENGVLSTDGDWDTKWKYLLDTSALHHKNYIRPEFSGIQPCLS